jgi:osmotically-inducible protein OsmY
MKSDAELKRDITAELDWDPAVDAAHVGVTVRDGVVTLTGHLDSLAEKHAVELAVQRVHGVKAMAVELEVKPAPGHRRSDAEIAQAAESALLWHALVPHEQILIKVEGGLITLSGAVDWQFQRAAAEHALRQLTGVVGVRNLITLKPQITPTQISQRIHDALARHAEREARHVEVRVVGSIVTLCGPVGSWHERAMVQGAAWSAPGVTEVVDELCVKD